MHTVDFRWIRSHDGARGLLYIGDSIIRGSISQPRDSGFTFIIDGKPDDWIYIYDGEDFGFEPDGDGEEPVSYAEGIYLSGSTHISTHGGIDVPNIYIYARKTWIFFTAFSTRVGINPDDLPSNLQRLAAPTPELESLSHALTHINELDRELYLTQEALSAERERSQKIVERLNKAWDEGYFQGSEDEWRHRTGFGFLERINPYRAHPINLSGIYPFETKEYHEKD